MSMALLVIVGLEEKVSITNVINQDIKDSITVKLKILEINFQKELLLPHYWILKINELSRKFFNSNIMNSVYGHYRKLKPIIIHV